MFEVGQKVIYTAANGTEIETTIKKVNKSGDCQVFFKGPGYNYLVAPAKQLRAGE